MEKIIVFFISFILNLMLLIPLFKLISPLLQSWTLLALFATSLLGGIFLFLILEILDTVKK